MTEKLIRDYLWQIDTLKRDKEALGSKLADCKIQINMLCNAKDGYFKLWVDQTDKLKEVEINLAQVQKELEYYKNKYTGLEAGTFNDIDKYYKDDKERGNNGV